MQRRLLDQRFPALGCLEARPSNAFERPVAAEPARSGFDKNVGKNSAGAALSSVVEYEEACPVNFALFAAIAASKTRET